MDTGAPGSTSGTFFPFIHLRNNKQSLAANTASTEYLHSVKMAKKLGLDYMEMHDAVHESPDIADIAQAYITLLVPALSTNELDQRYLFDFFDQLAEAEVIDSVELDEATGLVNRVIRRVAILIQDTKVKHTLSFTGLVKRLVPSATAVVGTHNSGYTTVAGVKGKYHYFRRQITPNVYEELQVYGLEMRYWVDGKYSAVGEEEDAALLIPLDYSITRNYPLKVQEQLYARSLNLVANSSITAKVKWYQRPAFANFLKIVGIVLMFTVGGLGASLYAAAAAGVIEVISLIVVTVLTSVVVSYAFQLIVKLVGTEFALLLAVVAALYGGYQVLDKGLKAAAVFASEMLRIATGLVKATAKVVMDDLLELSKEFDAFKEESEKQWELLQQTKDLLSESTRFNPLVIFGETPENYYNRTVHSGNVGIIGYQAIESYVDISLTLPTIADTLGGTENGV